MLIRIKRSRARVRVFGFCARRFLVGVDEPGAVAQSGQVGQRPHVLRHHQPGPAFAFAVASVGGRQRPAPTAATPHATPTPPTPASGPPPATPAPATTPAPAVPSRRRSRRRRRRGVGFVVRRRRAIVVVQTTITAAAAAFGGDRVDVAVHVAPIAPIPPPPIAVGRWWARDVRVGDDDGRGSGVRGGRVYDDAAAVRAGQQQLPRSGSDWVQPSPIAAHAQQTIVAAAPAAAPFVVDKLPEVERFADARSAHYAAQTARGGVGHGRGHGPAEHGHDDNAAAEFRTGHVDWPQRPITAVAGTQRDHRAAAKAAAIVSGRYQTAEDGWRRRRRRQ